MNYYIKAQTKEENEIYIKVKQINRKKAEEKAFKQYKGITRVVEISKTPFVTEEREHRMWSVKTDVYNTRIPTKTSNISV